MSRVNYHNRYFRDKFGNVVKVWQRIEPTPMAGVVLVQSVKTGRICRTRSASYDDVEMIIYELKQAGFYETNE